MAMAGLPSMVFASLALALLVASCVAFPGPAPEPAAPGVAAPAAAPRAAAPDLDPSAPGAPRSKAEARDLQGSETFGLGYYGLGYGYGYPLTYASYYYPRYSSYYVRPYRYYSYSYPYWDDWYSSSYSYW